jgi:G3E family GTPase
MSQLLEGKAKDIYRSKGVLLFDGMTDQKYVFQGVHEQVP